MPVLLVVLIVLAIVFDFLNGVHDSSNIVATMISSRAIRPRAALAMTAVAEFCGPFIFGVAVANTIGNEIVSSEHLNMPVIIAALVSAIVWNILTWLLGFPSSSSHALIGGIIGAVVVGAGFKEIEMAGVIKVLITLFHLTRSLVSLPVCSSPISCTPFPGKPHPRLMGCLRNCKSSPRWDWLSAMAPMMRKRPWGSSRWVW